MAGPTFDVLALRDRFDRAIRANPPAQIGQRTEWAGGVLRRIGGYNMIDWWDFGADAAFEAAAREAAFYAPLGPLKWKVYDHDGPANLADALTAAGFKAVRRETFLLLDLAAMTNWPPAPSDVEVRRVTDRAGVADMVAVQEAAFGEPANWNVDTLVERLADPQFSIFVAYLDGRPVSSGRLELFAGTEFAGLNGGGTVPDLQGRGVYRAVVAARAAAAREHGAHYLAVDARDTSRPILERLGFTPIVGLTSWWLRT
jgi:GNAT superfamily N-acetyltransferase